MIEIKATPTTRKEIAAKAGYDILRREKWVRQAHRVVEVPEDIEQLMRPMRKGNKIFLETRGGAIEIIIDWLEELGGWGFAHPDWPVPETGIPEK